MTITIALAGKGSAGKTTLLPSLRAAAAARRPAERRLVVDADPHQSLTTLLGHQGCPTVAGLRSAYERELLTGAALREDESREAFLEARMGQEAVVTTPGDDFLSLGQWELAGSQCTPHRVLARAVGGLLTRYDLVLIDHEAGVEHLGRYATMPLDALVIVATPERMSLDVAGRIAASARRDASGCALELEHSPGKLGGHEDAQGKDNDDQSQQCEAAEDRTRGMDVPSGQ